MSFFSILAWVLIAVFLLLVLAFYSHEHQRERKTATIAFDAVIIAIVFVMGMVPQLGYIQVFPWLSLTILHIPVLVGAARFGPKRGLVYGLAFGLTSMFQAMINGAGLNALFVYPWIAIPPRLLFGWFAGLAFSLMEKSPKLSTGVMKGVAAFLLTLVHTCLVFEVLFVFHAETIGGYFASSDPISEGIALTFAASIAVGAIGEALLAAILVPLVDRPLRKLSLGRE